MSMRRVSSRPRLVSDADRASKIATLDLENYYSSDNDDDGHHQNSYFLFEHDDDNANNNGRDDDFSGEEMKKKSSAAVLVADGHNDEEGCHCHHKMNNTSTSAATKILSPSISDDTLSDYASCCPLYDDDANNHPSLITNLEMSFKKTSLSSNEDDEEGGGGMLEAAVAAYTDRQLLTTTTTTNNSASVKRKRLSQQHYLTPNSSYAELHQISWYGQSASSSSSMSPPPLPQPASYNGVVQTYSRKQPYHYASKTTTSASPSRTNTTSPLVLLTLTHLPEETLVLISTHLTHTDIRSFGSTCHSIRMVLMCSTCAIENLWMERLRSRFPIVFSNNNNNRGIRGGGGGGGGNEEEGRRMMHSSNVTFVDDFGLPMAAASVSTSGGVIGGVDDTNMSNVGSTNSSSNRVNLPLLTGLLAPRYPQVIDLHASVGDGVFRSFDMSIPTTTADASSDVGVNPPVMDEVVVSVIQFTGRVGTGDRSIRSDKAFPPNCRVIANNSSSNNNSSSSSHGGASLKSLSTWMKNHTPLRSRGNKRKNGRSSSHSLLRDSSPPPSPLLRHNRHNFPTLSSSPTTRHPSYARRSLLTHTTATAPPPPSQRSPLFRFLSSLSHHCDSISSSSNISSFDDHETAMDDIGTTFSMENHGSYFDEDDDDIGVNDYGMMIRHNGNGLLEQCKQKFGKMYDGHCNKSMKDNLRPFVVPTVVSSSSSSGMVLVGEEDVSVDVTPRLVAYFEVTILDENVQRGDGETLNRRNNERHLAQQQQQQPPQQAVLNNGLRRRGDPPPRLLRRDIRRHNNNHQLWGMMPHRVVFPPILLPLQFDPEMFAPMDAQERFVAQAHRAPPPPPPNNNNNFGQPPPQFFHNDHGINNDNIFQQRQRHDCVAIGLSTLSFNPRSKMPGWDEHSFGYHGDDGGIFHGHGDMLRRYGPSFGLGDTVGCGLEYSTRKIFFVKNGIFLGWAFEKIDKEMVERGLYPTVGVDTECPIHVNFGQVPFKFDWKGFSREKLFV